MKPTSSMKLLPLLPASHYTLYESISEPPFSKFSNFCHTILIWVSLVLSASTCNEVNGLCGTVCTAATTAVDKGEIGPVPIMF